MQIFPSIQYWVENDKYEKREKKDTDIAARSRALTSHACYREIIDNNFLEIWSENPEDKLFRTLGFDKSKSG